MEVAGLVSAVIMAVGGGALLAAGLYVFRLATNELNAAHAFRARVEAHAPSLAAERLAHDEPPPEPESDRVLDDIRD